MFCCTVRYSLSESTVFLVGEYGIPCRRVRYSLSESTVFLVGEYGIAFWVLLRGIIAAFAGLLSKLPSEPGSLAARGGANLSESTVFFVGEYGIDLLDGTVLEGTGRESRSCRRVRYSSETLACLLERYLWQRYRSPGRSQAQELITLIGVMRDGRLAGGYGILMCNPARVPDLWGTSAGHGVGDRSLSFWEPDVLPAENRPYCKHSSCFWTVVEWYRDPRGPPLYSGLGDCPNNPILSFPSPEEDIYPYIRGHSKGGLLWHTPP
jgi:hypothetical protein